MARLTVAEASDPYIHFMLPPAPRGPEICPVCRGFPGAGYAQCFTCARIPARLDAVLPITYAPALEQMHTELRGYKDSREEAVRRRFAIGLTAVLWRFLAQHEQCLARAVGATEFNVVTVVPSSTRVGDESRLGLRTIVGHMCGHTAPRFQRLLRAAHDVPGGHEYDPSRFAASAPLDGRDVLLVDDTWTTGANAQSAAHALKSAGARHVGLVVIGRYVNRSYQDHGGRLDHATIGRRFEWHTCALHDG